MEKPLSYILMLSLKEIALRRMAVFLWNNSDILALIGNLSFKSTRFGQYEKIWRETVETKVTEKMSKIGLPGSLTKQVMQILKPIGSQIHRWKIFHEAYLSDSSENFDVTILEQLCWTCAGTIDYKETAEQLARCNAVDIVKRYKLACLYCFEDCIPVFWEELPGEIKNKFYQEEDTSQIERPHLQFCWPYILKGEQSKLDYVSSRSGTNLRTFHRYAFEYSAYKSNKTAAEYFFQKLSYEEREASLVRTAHAVVAIRNFELYQYPDDFPREKCSDVLCYLLSLMTPEQQMQIHKQDPCGVLICFLDWPWQDFFLKIADIIWDFLPVRDYNSVLFKMKRNIERSGYYFPKLFQDFFLHSPSDFRKCFLDLECRLGLFFRFFFDFHDLETIKVIFRNVDAADRVRLVSSKPIFKHFYDFISRGRWNMVEVCLREATLSKEDSEKLKEAFMGFLTRTDRGKIKWRKRKWKRFFLFLDETIAVLPAREARKMMH